MKSMSCSLFSGVSWTFSTSLPSPTPLFTYDLFLLLYELAPSSTTRETTSK